MSRWACAAGAATMLAATGAAAATLPEVYAERTAMIEADARCRLFEPGLAAALGAARAQARGAALRAGADPAELDRIAGRARAGAAALPCTSPRLAAWAARVRSAFEGWSRAPRMSFPGETAVWEAARPADGDGGWRLSQAAPLEGGTFRFGLAGPGAAALTAVADFGPGPGPYAARLVLRDPGRTSGPYLGAPGLGAGRPPALARRLPPRTAARVFQASGRGPAAPALRPARSRTALAFRFPDAAAGAIEALDPREAVAVEFLFGGRGGEAVRTAYVEVGDFAAGRAFLSAAPRRD